MLKNRCLSYVLALLMLATLSACGFKLRSAADIAIPFKTIYLGFPENSSLGIELRRYIRSGGGTEVVTERKQAEAIVEITQPEKQERLVIATNAGQVVEYRLYYRFAFRVRDNKDRELLPNTSYALYRDVSFNAAQALAKEAEDQTRYKDMQSDLVQQILRRLSAIKPVAEKPDEQQPK